MKNILYAILLSGASLGFFSCSETDYPLFDDSVINIYFTNDSTHYSFGITPLSVTERIVELPVKIIGAPVNENRSFKIEIVDEKTNAMKDTHFKLPDTLEIAKDSVNGIVPITLIREHLDTIQWQVTVRLVDNSNFSPTPAIDEKMGAIGTITFNNVVSKPTWINPYTGADGWPTYQLGPWNPTVYVIFMDFFHQLKDNAPMTYLKMVEKYGENLEKYSGWDYDYDYTLTKYILIPMHQYFQDHPELGITDFPNPGI